MPRKAAGPEKEFAWERINAPGGRYLITTKSMEDRSIYRLWREEDVGWKKVGEAKTPRLLQEKFL